MLDNTMYTLSSKELEAVGGGFNGGFIPGYIVPCPPIPGPREFPGVPFPIPFPTPPRPGPFPPWPWPRVPSKIPTF